MNYKKVIQQINSLPILLVAELVVPKFINRGKNSIGQCVLHEDNKLTNLKFHIEGNFAHCFTCDTTWTPYRLLKDFGKFKNIYEVVKFLKEQGIEIEGVEEDAEEDIRQDEQSEIEKIKKLGLKHVYKLLQIKKENPTLYNSILQQAQEYIQNYHFHNFGA